MRRFRLLKVSAAALFVLFAASARAGIVSADAYFFNYSL